MSKLANKSIEGESDVNVGKKIFNETAKSWPFRIWKWNESNIKLSSYRELICLPNVVWGLGNVIFCFGKSSMVNENAKIGIVNEGLKNFGEVNERIEGENEKKVKLRVKIDEKDEGNIWSTLYWNVCADGMEEVYSKMQFRDIYLVVKKELGLLMAHNSDKWELSCHFDHVKLGNKVFLKFVLQ